MKLSVFLYYVVAITSFCAGMTVLVLFDGENSREYLAFLFCMAVSGFFLWLAQRHVKE